MKIIVAKFRQRRLLFMGPRPQNLSWGGTRKVGGRLRSRRLARDKTTYVGSGEGCFGNAKSFAFAQTCFIGKLPLS